MSVSTVKDSESSPLERLLRLMGDDSPTVRKRALENLKQWGEPLAKSLGYSERVADMVRDSDAKVREAAMQTLSTMGSEGGKYSSVLVDKLKSDTKADKIAAIEALGNLGKNALQHVDDLVPFMGHSDLTVAAAACLALGRLNATSCSSKLAAKLSVDDREVLMAAAEALILMDCDIDKVAKLLSHKSPAVQAHVVGLLPQASGAEKYASTAATLVGSSEGTVRRAARTYFGALGEKAASEAPKLAKLLSDTSAGVRACACSALGSLGLSASSHLPAVEALLDDTAQDCSAAMMLAVAGVVSKAPAEVRRPCVAAAVAIPMMGLAAHKSGAAKVAAGLKSSDPEVRSACLEALAKMGPHGANFEDDVAALLKDPMPFIVAEACKTLGKLAEGSGRTGSSDSVADCLNDKIPSVRAHAAEALGKMGEEVAVDHIETFARLLQDRVFVVRRNAIFALTGCGEAGQMYAASICRMAMDDDSLEVRIAALEALPLLGERGAAFVDEISGLVDEPLPPISEAAKKTMDAMLAATPTFAQPILDATPSAPAPTSAVEEPAATPEAPAAPSQPPLPVGLIFPGQGSQYVKMLSEAKDLPAVKAMCEQATKILGYDILSLCLNGPESKLEETEFCQPVMFVGGLAGMEMLRKEQPDKVDRCKAVAGLSLGEYTALAAAGVFDFETGLKIVQLRGQAMQAAAKSKPQSMISVAGLDQKTVEKLCSESKSGPDDVAQIANFLFEKGYSCAGSKTAMDKLMEKALKTNGCLQARAVKTSGAFHTSFMQPARQKLHQALKDVESKLKPPRCDVYMNVTGRKIGPETNPGEIVDLLAEQLTSSVMWEQSMKAMIKDGVSEFYECGPMKQLKAMMKRIDQDAWNKTTNVAV